MGSSPSAIDLIKKWGPGGSAYGLSERAGAQPHFIDLCRLLGAPEPSDPDSYCFEKGLTKTGGAGLRTDGFADVWLKGHFAWEYKAPGKSLSAALSQLMMYALPLESPPLLVVSDRLRIEVHTHFTGTPSECHVFLLEDLQKPEVQNKLQKLWTDPDFFRPKKNNREITEEAANTFAETAHRLRNAGVKAPEVSHFLTQCLFCFFAEDVGLLPSRLFERLVGVKVDPVLMQVQLTKLFESMRDGGLFGVDHVPWFNGGLFKVIKVPQLTEADISSLKAASALDWSAIDPSIFGTLFERGLHPNKRSQLGAHYTDPATILKLVEPVVKKPLMLEWEQKKPLIEKHLAKSKKYGDKGYRDAKNEFIGFLERLRTFRVLDPACGSGNFLYLSLKCLKDIEHQVNLEAEALGLERQHDLTGPHNVLGIELDEYAAELARVTVWIGELQWRVQRGYGFKSNPVLEPLDHIEHRDALINADGSEAEWPKANVVVGNPPFLGTKKMFGELGIDYTKRLRAAYEGRVPGFADLVCYWYEKSRAKIVAGDLSAAGLVSTDSIRGGANREVLDRIAGTAKIYNAWNSLKWVNDGASVRVSLVAFASASNPTAPELEGQPVAEINADLTAGQNLTKAQKLRENVGAAFVATVKSGSFDIPGDVARQWLALPNPHGQSNAMVLKPWANGMDVIRRSSDTWIIDFGVDMPEGDAALFEEPFKHVVTHVKPARDLNKRSSYRNFWWLMAEPIPKMREALKGLNRYIGTPVLAKHRVFTWLDASILPDHQLVVVARSDDTNLGILHSRFHRAWSLRLGTSLEDRPRYTPTTTFETFPFPPGITPADTADKATEVHPDGTTAPLLAAGPARQHAFEIGKAAKQLHELRQRWLNPTEWIKLEADVTPAGMKASPYPPRIVPLPGHEADLKKRTLTNLYNESPTWLVKAHEALDLAVAKAYGWVDYVPAMSDEEIFKRLLSLNASRA